MSELAAVIASLAALVTAVGGVVLAFSVLIPIRRNAAQIHTMVNQQRTDMQRYTRSLVDTLHRAGVEVPLDESLGAPGERED